MSGRRPIRRLGRAAFYRATWLSTLLSFYFHEVLEQLKNEIYTDFHFEKALRFVIQYAWISKLLRDIASQLSCWFKKVTYFKGFCYLNSHFIRKGTALMFMSSLRDEFSKTQWQMFFINSLYTIFGSWHITFQMWPAHNSHGKRYQKIPSFRKR